jgi:phosphate transport system permease protein
MATTMVIGNTPQVSLSLNAPQYTMAAVLANEYSEAATPLYRNALTEICLLLFVITLIINMMSRAFIWTLGRPPKRRMRPTTVVTANAEAA